MYCPEQRIPRELFWSGFGFQVWCQMLTHVIQSREASLFLIDEPDIYLHSDLQRQLLGILRNLGPDILLATHSTEIVTEAETDDILLVNKGHRQARRIKDPAQLEQVFNALGSNLNPILTQLAKTRRALFVEGKDFQILGKFARKLGANGVGNRREFAVIPVEGFNPERIRSLKTGMEMTLGSKIQAAAILDRDYRSDGECAAIQKECETFCNCVIIHRRKEIENFLLVPAALDRAAAQKVLDQARRANKSVKYSLDLANFLNAFCDSKRTYITSQILSDRRRFERANSPGLHETEVNEAALNILEQRWADPSERLALVPGKEAFSAVNRHLQEKYGVNITSTAAIEAMQPDEIPKEIVALVEKLKAFSTSKLTH
jgi:predicted ATP-dependent endonuclease of OLD family